MWTFFSQGTEDCYTGLMCTDDTESNLPSETASLLSKSSRLKVKERPKRNRYGNSPPSFLTPKGSNRRIDFPLISPRSATSNGSAEPLLLQSMLFWDVAVPPVKQHVIGGKLVETFQASLYGNDTRRNLPVAKRRLTIEVYGDREHTNVFRRRTRRRQQPQGRFRFSSSHENYPQQESQNTSDPFATWIDCNELAERDIVVLKVMKSRLVNEYDDDFGFGIHNSISEGLRDRKWESQSMSDKTMLSMMGVEECNGVDIDRIDDGSHREADASTNVRRKALQMKRNRKKNIRWIELSRTRLSQIEIVRMDLEADEVDLKMGVGLRTIVQTFHFGDEYGSLGESTSVEGNAWNFSRVVELLQDLEKERAKRLADLHKNLISPKLTPESDQWSSRFNNHQPTAVGVDRELIFPMEDAETVNILVEIVSASDLPPPTIDQKDSCIRRNLARDDFKMPSPDDFSAKNHYVVVRDGRMDVHTTSIISNTENPIWTLSTGSLCLIKATNLLDFFQRSNVLEFTVKTHCIPAATEDEIIGTVMIHKTELLRGTGERTYYQILRLPLAGSTRTHDSYVQSTCENEKIPYLYLRYRNATPEDIHFMSTLCENRNKNGGSTPYGVYASDSILPSPQRSAHSNSSRNDPSTGLLQHRVQPYPDPENAMKTQWMTHDMIQQTCKEHSRAWVMGGSGSMGKVYLEILGCDGLPCPPEVDERNPFVCVVYEDSVFNTDVIWNSLSPRWMPWCQRAFVAKMMYPSSQLYLGVLDGNRMAAVEDHLEDHYEPLGRVTINMMNLRPNAIHTLTYKLTRSKMECEKQLQPIGTITIRLRIALDDERQALLSELTIWRNPLHVSSVEWRDFRSVSYTVGNDPSHQDLNFNHLIKFTSELIEGTKFAISSTVDALVVVLFWRGHYLLTFFLLGHEISCHLPIHSIVAFFWVTVLALDFQKIVSFVWFVPGWILLATMEVERKHPSPWRRPRSYWELLRILLRGKTVRPRRTILPNENLEETERYEAQKEQRNQIRERICERRKRERRKQMGNPLQNGRQPLPNRKQKHDASNEEIVENKERFSPTLLDQHQAILLPVQETLYLACVVRRIATSILQWRDSYSAFWIVTICFSFSVFSFWIPWDFILKWGFTIGFMFLFGPWMKVVEIYCMRWYFRYEKGVTNDLRAIAEYEKRYELLFEREWGTDRIRRENAMKLEDTKRYMFGQHLTKVPIYMEECFTCEASASSSSVPYNTNPRPVNVVKRIHGQQLWGDMVPYRENDLGETNS